MNPLKPISIETFILAFERGVAAFEEAGRILVQLLDQDPLVIERILEKYPRIRAGTLRKFVRIGKGQLLPACAFSESQGIRALARLDIADQRKHLEGNIELLIINGGKSEMLLVQVESLTNEQVRQVFATDHVRSLGEQRLWIEARRKLALPLPSDPLFITRRDRIVIPKPCTLTQSDILRMLTELMK